MEAFLLIARLILSVVFGVAGIAKLKDRAGSEKAIADFGIVPPSWAKPLGVLLPLGEVVIAVLLLPLTTAWTGAVFAAILLAVFVGAIGYNLAQGKTPDCHCFGQVHSEPVGISVLIRNSLLLVTSFFIIFFGRETAGLSAFEWMTNLSNGERVQLFFGLILSGLLTVVVFSLKKIQQNQVILQRQIEVLELASNEEGTREVERENVAKPSRGLPVGAITPDFVGTDLDGKQVTFEHLLMRGKPMLLFFVGPNCLPCQAMLINFESWQRQLGKNLTVVMISTGKPEENQKYLRFDEGQVVLLQREREIAEMFRSQWTPGAVFINADGTIGSALATGDIEILNLMDVVRPAIVEAANKSNGNGFHTENLYVLPKHATKTTAPRAGQAIPNFTLPDLNGKNVSVSDFRGKKTLLVFWRETCGYCAEIRDELLDWEAGQIDFNVVILATDEPEIAGAKDFRSSVLRESNLEIQRMLDHDGTPSALILDENGKIISDIAAGVADVRALIGKYE